ncbi:minor capsid protein [Microbacterium sp.]|jgi:hypothetical protein|uniref:minor capsid protein n=1 Tax=Microbacterium sp. TaxID=51671 RepID=UPI0037CBF216
MDDASLTRLVCSILGMVPTWEWRPDGDAYADNETAIFYGALDPTPDSAIGVRVYGPLDDPLRHVYGRRVQLRFRGRKNQRDAADRMAGTAFAVLDGLSRVGGISGIRRFSFGPSVTDDNGREERTDNYSITLDNPEASTS